MIKTTIDVFVLISIFRVIVNVLNRHILVYFDRMVHFTNVHIALILKSFKKINQDLWDVWT